MQSLWRDEFAESDYCLQAIHTPLILHVHQANALQDRMMQLPVQIVRPLGFHQR